MCRAASPWRSFPDGRRAICKAHQTGRYRTKVYHRDSDGKAPPVTLGSYEDVERIKQSVMAGQHRDAVGGMWEEIGRLQLNFLIANGLARSSKLIDIGCGCLRGGTKFISYLDENLYFGIDSNSSLLDAGYNIELKSLGLENKLQQHNLVCDDGFCFDAFEAQFDFAIAQSLFTHLPLNQIKLCLSRLATKMNPGGKFFASFFLVVEDHPFGQRFTHLGGVTSFDAKDPYHYRFSEIAHLCHDLPWKVNLIGEWGHPRDQRMVEFLWIGEKTKQKNPNSEAVRFDDFESAKLLPAGSNHYRAYVGPPDRYDFMSASQFALMFALGLRDYHKVLDIGCGSLRLGRLLIPFLRPANYFGIDPNRWLIDDAVDRELGRSILEVKQPSFAHNDDFGCDIFDATKKFEFVVAQSIITHCGGELAEKVARESARVLAKSGRFLFSVIEDPEESAWPSASGWVYPNCVAFGAKRIEEMCARSGLTCRRLPWFHPGAVWYIAANKATDLPSDQEMTLLKGAVLFDPQFEKSRVSV
jgi:SAM-dependent methyltransferase